MFLVCKRNNKNKILKNENKKETLPNLNSLFLEDLKFEGI